ncbi:MAG: ABC transporter ATP-binding protein [Candidatus Thermoplasmatota archaeon]|nr:ABC transporter ATP-binding protein [Candidatus Thermoplasmatota archaeon]
MISEFAIETNSVTKVYMSGKQEFKALKNITIKIKKGDFIAIMGPSGSGKSTLMNLLGCLDRPTNGEIILEGENITRINDNRLADIRCNKVGFIFQTFNLIPTMNALKNIALPMTFGRINKSSREKAAIDLLKKFSLENWANHRPSELSGGQQQRVAIARALANNPSIILADEPTGNLDSETGQQVMKLLSSINKEGKTILLVTHDSSLKKYTNKVINMIDGKIVG